MVSVPTFWISFVITLALLAGTVWTGFRGRRTLHATLAVLTVVLLTITVLLTEALLRAVVFPAREMGIHLLFAKSGAALVLPVAVTGILTWRTRSWRRVHLACVVLFLLVAVTATGTGIWVYSLATPR